MRVRIWLRTARISDAADICDDPQDGSDVYIFDSDADLQISDDFLFKEKNDRQIIAIGIVINTAS